MFIRPKDYISVNDKLFFAVVSENQEDDRALTWLRYVKNDNEFKKLNTEEAGNYIKENHPEFIYHSSYADIDLHGIPLDLITQVYRPDQTVVRLLKITSPDIVQKDAIYIINLLVEAGVKQEVIGITGSIMLNTHNNKSDIDMIIYGRDQFFTVRQLIQSNIESGKLKLLDDTFWQDAFQRRDCTLSFDEYKKHELRKYNKCISGSTKVDVSMIPEKYERVEEKGPYKKIGRDKIISRVTDDTYAYDFPARYTIAHDVIKELVSYTATYTGQAVVGEKIEAEGYIEQDRTGENRLVVGTSREAYGEYIRVVN